MTANLVFIGFHGAADRSTPESQNEIIADLLADAGYHVRSGSATQQQIPRLADQLRLTVATLRWADAVIACQFSGRRAVTTYLLTHLTRWASIPTVIVLRGGSLPDAAQAHPRWFDPTLRRATRILAPSAYLQRAFEQRGHRVGIAPNLVRAKLATGDRAGIDPAAPRILWMRAFHPTYQPDLAVAAFALLVERFPGARLTMAGPDRGLLDATRRQAADLGVGEQVTFPGYVEADGKAAAFRDHDVFLNTTLIDNTPVSVIEAMGAGLPVVATDVGGLRDLARPDRDALLVPDGDAPGLADALARIITQPELAEAMRHNGRAIAERHGAEHVRQTWVSILSEIGAPLGRPPQTGCGALSVADVDQVAELHSEVFADSGLTGLGRRVVRRYYRWQFSGPHPQPVAVGAWRNGDLVGFVVGGARREAVAGFVRTSPATLAIGAVTHPLFVRRIAGSKVRAITRAIRHNRRAAPPVASPLTADSLIAAASGPSFGILSIAVAADQQGTGVAGELLDAAEHEARERGFDRMNLSVNVDNERAIRFYEKHGWHRSATSPWDGKMAKDLTES